MPGYGRRRSQNPGALILIAAILVLWYLGKIPGVPPLAAVLPQVDTIRTEIPAATELFPLVSQGTPVASPAALATWEPIKRRSKTSGCISANALPDPKCTPGAIFPAATKEQICTPGYSTQVRNVTQSTKDQVYAEYGIASHEPGQYEVDHLISLELGGSNGIANLWPEPADPRPGFHEKDQVEDYLHGEVCDGRMSLQEAQSLIAHDWYTVYQGMPK